MTASAMKKNELLVALAERMTHDRIKELASIDWCGWTARQHEHVSAVVETLTVPPTEDWDSEVFTVYRWSEPTGTADNQQRTHEIRAFCCATLLLTTPTDGSHAETLCCLTESLLLAMPKLLVHLPKFLDDITPPKREHDELPAFIEVVRLLLGLHQIVDMDIMIQTQRVLDVEQHVRGTYWRKNTPEAGFAGLRKNELTRPSTCHTLGQQLEMFAERAPDEELQYCLNDISGQLLRL